MSVLSPQCSLLSKGSGRSQPRHLGCYELACGLGTSSIGSLADLIGGAFLVGGVEVEIDPAQRTFVVGLAEDDGDLAVQGDAMAQVGSAVFVSFDRFFHEGSE